MARTYTGIHQLTPLIVIVITLPFAQRIANGQDNFVGDVNVQGGLCVGSTSCSGVVATPPDIHIKSTTPGMGFFYSAADAWRLEASTTGNDEFTLRETPSQGLARTVMQISSGAPENSLVITATGHVGLGTAAPTDELTLAFPSPSMKFIDTDTNKNWDIDANSAGFFVTEDGFSRMMMDVGGNVGFGTTIPMFPLHVVRSSGDATIQAQSTGSGNAMLNVVATGTGQPGFHFLHGSSGNFWDFRAGGAGNTILNANGGAVEFTFFSNGNLLMNGTLTTGGPACSGGCDAVFTPGFQIESIEEHARAMWEMGHLPAVGPTEPGEPFNVTEKLGGVLNEIEKAHIYIEQLHRRLADKDEQIADLEARVERIEALLSGPPGGSAP